MTSCRSKLQDIGQMLLDYEVKKKRQQQQRQNNKSSPPTQIQQQRKLPQSPM